MYIGAYLYFASLAFQATASRLGMRSSGSLWAYIRALRCLIHNYCLGY